MDEYGQDFPKIVDLATKGSGDESLNGHLEAVKTIFWQRTCVVNMSYDIRSVRGCSKTTLSVAKGF